MDYYRRVSTGQQPGPDTVPPAPPLPPKRNSETAPKSGLLDRFQGILGNARRSVTGQQAESAQELRHQLSYTGRYGSSKSRSASHRTGLKIRALDINHARTHAVLAGGKILKTVRVEEGRCCEDFNIRAAAVNYAWEATVHDGSKKTQRASEDVSAIQRETFDIEDVAWSNGPNFSSHIATAASNGRIMLYDLERPVVEIGRLHEHNRQVHKVDFNPSEGRFLLSGSQDGTVRLWDLRTLQRNVMICYSRDTFPGRNDGVRHTKWSPTDTWTFALGTDNGTVQRWDTRQNKAPVLKIAAHSDTCNSIDWHPDGKHLVSAGKDQNVKIWNLTSDRRQKPSFLIRAPKEVQNVRWRPPCFVSDGPDSYLKQTTYLATSYKAFPIVHVWDLRRPFMPFREIYHNVNSGTNDMLWHSKDILWTVGSEGEFCQTDVPFSFMTLDRRPLQSLAHSPTGDLAFLTQSLQSTPTAPTDTSGEDTITDEPKIVGSASPTKKPGRSLLSDDSFEERFLSTSVRKWHSRTPSLKSSRSLGSTPPSVEDVAKPVTHLDEAMRYFHDTAPHQVSLYGPCSGGQSRQVFAYLAQRYMKLLQQHNASFGNIESFARLCSKIAKSLSKAGRLADANVWTLIGRDFGLWLHSRQELRENGEINFNLVTTPRKSMPHPNMAGFATSAKRFASQDSLLADKAAREISGSNVLTPVALPLKKPPAGIAQSFEGHEDVDAMEQLPPSLNSHDFAKIRPSMPAEPLRQSRDSQEGFKESAPAVERRQGFLSQYRAQQRTPLDLDQYQSNPQLDSDKFYPPLHRHDSGESFLMFSTSSESRPQIPMHHSFSSSAAASDRRGNGSWNESDAVAAGSALRSDSGEQAPFLGASYSLSSARPNMGTNDGKAQSSGDSMSMSLADEDDRPEKSSSTASNTHLSRTDSRRSDEIAIIDGSPLDRALSSQSLSPLAVANQSGLVDTIVLAPIEIGYGEGFLLDDDTCLKIDLFGKLLERYASVSDAQLASQLFIICRSILLPSASQLKSAAEDLVSAHPVLESCCAHLTHSTGFSPSVAQSIIVDNHLVLEEIGIASAMVESILATYHSQLLSHRLHNAAASLRQVAYPAFPAVYEQAFQSVDLGLLCTYCSNPINNPRDKTICETCKKAQSPCAVCLLPESPFSLLATTPLAKKGRGSRKSSYSLASTSAHLMPGQAGANTSTPTDLLHSPILRDADIPEKSKESKTRLFVACALCNHSLHMACAYTWFEDSIGGGACPVESCLCDCAPGLYRDEKLAGARLQAEIRRGLAQSKPTMLSSGVATPTANVSGTSPNARASAVASSIRRDEWDVGQSRAVRSVRGALRESNLSTGGGAVSDGEVDRPPRVVGAGSGPRRRGGLIGRSNSGRNSEAGLEGASASARRVRVVGPGE